MRVSSRLLPVALVALTVFAQDFSINGVAWTGYAHDAQHTAVSATAAQSLSAIHWHTPVDLNPQFSGSSLLIHYGSPLVTAANTVLVPVKTGAADGFKIEAFNGVNGAPLYTLTTDYTLPPHSWTPSYGPALSGGFRDRVYYAGAGGTIFYRDKVDSAAGRTGRLAFYGLFTYLAHSIAFNNTVMISTPLTVDRLGNIYFGFVVTGSNPANLTSGLARITADGFGSWIDARTAAGGDNSITQVAMNCAPALSNGRLYFAVSNGAELGFGYLVSVNSTTLAPIARVALMDPRGGLATVSTDSSASPMIGPDGDVYYGVLEGPCCSSHNDRGWMLHFNSDLSVAKIPGSFGWDDTASVVSAELVASYTGSSAYLILTKYNNYAGAGTGDGVNKLAVLDPNATQFDQYSTGGVQVMKEVLTVTGVTPDAHIGFPNAVREWCINTAAIDPATKSAIVNNEDGVLYRWNFTSNTLSQALRLTNGLGEAYTPTVIGMDGTAYAVNDAILFAVGQ